MGLQALRPRTIFGPRCREPPAAPASGRDRVFDRRFLLRRFPALRGRASRLLPWSKTGPPGAHRTRCLLDLQFSTSPARQLPELPSALSAPHAPHSGTRRASLRDALVSRKPEVLGDEENRGPVPPRRRVGNRHGSGLPNATGPTPEGAGPADRQSYETSCSVRAPSPTGTDWSVGVPNSSRAASETSSSSIRGGSPNIALASSSVIDASPTVSTRVER